MDIEVWGAKLKISQKEFPRLSKENLLLSYLRARDGEDEEEICVWVEI